MQNSRMQLLQSTSFYKELVRDCNDGAVKHSYVFLSSDFDTLYTLAGMFISLCEYGKVDDEVLQRIRSGGYLDIIKFPTAEKKGKMDVEDAANIVDTAYITPTELRTKYYIIAAPDGLSEPVQNKLLKTLEEPPESARFIVFSGGNDLLPTVTSRCSVVRLSEFPIEVIKNELIDGGADELTALFGAAVSRGNLGFAEKIIADSGYRQAYENAMNFMLNVARSPQILPSASAVISAKDKIGAFIDYLELILRDVMAYNECGVNAIVLKPVAKDIITLSKGLNTRTCLSLMPLLSKARNRLRLYANPSSLCDELMFSILEVKAKCRK